ncbi:DUF4194 domain-containing protein [Nocardioides sp. Bht2]|uniref:DUF4194 domain-containing protein n=1 Tax=Nocardioides sp. Bht2 TaxID=3392297 RepID=UPI0039B3F65B
MNDDVVTDDVVADDPVSDEFVESVDSVTEHVDGDGFAPAETEPSDPVADDEFATSDLRSVSLFEGDEGELAFAERQVLVTLLKQRFISARTHPREWRVLTEHERLLRSRLNDVFLELQIDRDREVAWKRQAVSETASRFPTLLHDTSWSREETLVLIHLRDRLRAGQAGGESRVFVDRDDVLDYIESFRPGHATDVAGDVKRAKNAVLAVAKAGLLIPTAADDRYEISEAVEPLLPLDLLKELLAALHEANTAPVPTPVRSADLFGEEWDDDGSARAVIEDGDEA